VHPSEPVRGLPWWRRDRLLAICAGVIAGFIVADLAVRVADRFGPTVTHSATVTEAYVEEPRRHEGHYHVRARTDSGETVDFFRTDTVQIYQDLAPGQRIEVSLSRVTGRPVAVDAAHRRYDFVGGRSAWGPLVFDAVLLVPLTGYLICVTGRVRNRWGLPALGVVFVYYVLMLTGFV
jgi:hypothetical protein